jgi:flagellar biosynthesis/type III secretory pathway M-ring protein FliF/YscJ
VAGALELVGVLIMNGIKKRKEAELETQRIQFMREQAEKEAAEAAATIDLVADEPILAEEIMAGEDNSMLSSIKTFVDKNPEAGAQIRRYWLLDDYRR